MWDLFIEPENDDLDEDGLERLSKENTQLKANNVELVEALEDVSKFLDFAWRDIEMNDYSFTLLEEVICKVQRQIAKAKEE